MGGKKKQAQRVKNNAKPSSSGRAAEQLLSSGSLNLQGFSSSLKQNPFVSNHPSTMELYDPALDPHFVVVFKRLCKKDAITKQKALQELVTMSNGADDATIISILPSWVQIYANLVVDVEHRVREGAQHAHRVIVGRAKRNLAPFVKQVVPLWFISQYDTHAPAASTAALAFKEAFPVHKIVDVIVFCQEEILKYITGNLIGTMAEPKTKKTDGDSEAKYDRIIVSSLNGYSLYLTKIPSEKLDAVIDLNNDIIASQKFWKLCSHKSGSVRAAWFSLMSAILQHAPFLVEKEHKRVVNSVLSHIDDYDPLVLPTVWEATLHCVTIIKDSWEHVSVEKLVLGKLGSILNHGGRGSAYFIFPNILLLISKIPDEVLKNKIIFFTKIFSGFQEGSRQTSVTQSPSESEAVVTSFNECIRYLIMKNNEDSQFCRMLIDSHVLNFISNSMTNPLCRHQIIPFYTSLVQTIMYWKRNEYSNPNYKEYAQHFFSELIRICIRIIDETVQGADRSVMTFLFEYHRNMVEVMNFPYTHKKKKLKVHFSEEAIDVHDNAADDVVVNVPDQPEEISFKKDLTVFVEELVKLYFNIALHHDKADVRELGIEYLWKLSSILTSEQISSFMGNYGKDFYTAVAKWLNDPEVPCQSLVGLIFNTIHFVECSDQRNALLFELANIRSNEAIIQGIDIAVCSACPAEALKSWLQSESVKNQVIGILKSDVGCVDDVALTLLQKCLLTGKSGEFVMGESTVCIILDSIVTELDSGNTTFKNIHIDPCILIDSFFKNKLNNVKKHGTRIFNLLKTFFEGLVCGKQLNVLSAWKRGFEMVCEIFTIEDSLMLDHLKLCIDFVAEALSQTEDHPDLELDTVLKLITHMTFTLETHLKDSSPKFFLGKLFISSVLTKAMTQCLDPLERICCDSEVIGGQFDWQTIGASPCQGFQISKGSWDPLREMNLYGLSRSLLACLRYMLVLMGDYEELFEEIDVSRIKTNFLTAACPDINEYILKISYGTVLCTVSMQHYSSIKKCFEALENCSSLCPMLKEIVHRLDSPHQENLSHACTQRSNVDKKMWIEVDQMINRDILDLTPSEAKEGHKVVQYRIVAEDLYSLRKNRKDVEESAIRSVLQSLIGSYTKTSYSAQCMDVSKYAAEHLRLNAEVAWFLRDFLISTPEAIEKLSGANDFFMISVAGWCSSISQTKSPENCKEFVQFVLAFCELMREFTSHVAKAPQSSLYDEWNNVFAAEAYLTIFSVWKSYAEKTLTHNFGYLELLILNKLSQLLCDLCDSGILNSTVLKDEVTADWLEVAVKCVLSPHVPVQVTSYKILLSIVPQLVHSDESCDENSIERLSCQTFSSTLIETQNVVTTLLQDFSLGVSCSVSPYTDSYTYCLAYLMIWSLLLEMCRIGESVRYLYTLWIKEKKLMHHIMENTLKLMPDSILDLNVKKKNDFFSTQPPLSFDNWTSKRLSHYSCWLFCGILRRLPAVSRQWATEVDTKMYNFVEKLTSAYVSPILCVEEMEAIQNEQKSFDNMKVITQASWEVVAIYSLEESSTELTIKLATNHPLCPPKVEIAKHIKVSSNWNRQWLRQLTVFLTHQDGSIWAGLLLWKSNLDKKFEGIEECYICFSIVHNTSHQLPKIGCQTCKKKFHSLCLYKWFTTSHKSSCPICRNHF